MPTYEYRCEACGHEFEQFQSITASPLRKCPACGKQKVKRLISSGAGVIFKGSGFWETDYNRSEGYKKAAEKESGGGEAGKDKKADGGEKAKPAGDATSAASDVTPAKPDASKKPTRSPDSKRNGGKSTKRKK